MLYLLAVVLENGALAEKSLEFHLHVGLYRVVDRALFRLKIQYLLVDKLLRELQSIVSQGQWKTKSQH